MSQKELSRLETMEQLRSGSRNQSHAAKSLGLGIRQVIRLAKAFNKEGAKGLISKKRGRKSNHQLPEGVTKRALELILEKYADFGPTLAHEKLTEVHGMKISVGSVRNLMISHEIFEA